MCTPCDELLLFRRLFRSSKFFFVRVWPGLVEDNGVYFVVSDYISYPRQTNLVP